MQRIRNNNRLLPIVLMVVCGSTTALADIGPPVKIRLVKELVQPAVAGEEYHGAFEVLVGADGTLDSITVEGGKADICGRCPASSWTQRAILGKIVRYANP